jgi:hypothetical protein
LSMTTGSSTSTFFLPIFAEWCVWW